MIDQSPWRGHHNLHPPSQVIHLLPLGHPAINTRILNRRALSEFVAFLLDLQGELASRGEDEDDGSVALLEVGLEGGRGKRKIVDGCENFQGG